MSDLVQLLCIVVSVNRRSLLCFALAQSSRSGQTASGDDQVVVEGSAQVLRLRRLNRLCQVLLATAFLAVAASRWQDSFTGHYRRCGKENPLDVQIRQSVATVLMPDIRP